MFRNETSWSTLERYRTVTKATAVASIDAIHGMCSLLSMANEWSQAVSELASINERGNWLRSVTPAGGVAR